MRKTARRLAGLVFSLWFALYLGTPQLVHPCPTHSAKPSALSADTGEHTAHHGDHQAPSDQRGDHRDDCCCPGPQCGVAALSVEAPTAKPLVVAATAAPAPRDETLAAPGRPAFSLPFATAPPASLA